MATTEPSPAEMRLQACVDEYGLLGVVSVLRDLYGSARLAEVMRVAEHMDDDTEGTIEMPQPDGSAPPTAE